MNPAMETAQTHLNSLVFVGEQFSISMFDERALFDGKLDPDQLKMGPIGMFSYSSRTCQFGVMPERIDLRCHDEAIMPDRLIMAGRSMIAQLQSIGQKISIAVSGFGMNCDTVLDRKFCGISGSEFCRTLADPSVRTLAGVSSLEVLQHVRFIRNEIRYMARIEPDDASSGQNLFLAINGHQHIESSEELHTKLEKVEDFKAYVAGFHRRTADSAKRA